MSIVFLVPFAFIVGIASNSSGIYCKGSGVLLLFCMKLPLHLFLLVCVFLDLKCTLLGQLTMNET